MQVKVSGRHMGVTESIRSHCEQKSQKLSRFFDRIQSVEMVLDGHDGRHFAEIIVHMDGTHPFVASEEHDDIYAAIDLLMDKIERQVRRHKERLRNHRHQPRSEQEL